MDQHENGKIVQKSNDEGDTTETSPHSPRLFRESFETRPNDIWGRLFNALLEVIYIGLEQKDSIWAS